MGEKIRGNRVLTGAWAEVYWNGFKIAELEKIEAKITVNREDVQMGLDVDTKVTGLKGEGTLALKKVYTRFDDVRREITRGRDPRGSIVAKLKDPDAVGGQTERYQMQRRVFRVWKQIFMWKKRKLLQKTDTKFQSTFTKIKRSPKRNRFFIIFMAADFSGFTGYCG